MVIESIVLGVAFVGIFVLLIVRLVRLKKGLDDFSVHNMESLNNKLQSKWNAFRAVVRIGFVKSLHFATHIPAILKFVYKESKVVFYKRFKKSFDTLNGKGVLSTKGSMPLFFSSIKDHKEEIRKQN